MNWDVIFAISLLFLSVLAVIIYVIYMLAKSKPSLPDPTPDPDPDPGPSPNPIPSPDPNQTTNYPLPNIDITDSEIKGFDITNLKPYLQNLTNIQYSSNDSLVEITGGNEQIQTSQGFDMTNFNLSDGELYLYFTFQLKNQSSNSIFYYDYQSITINETIKAPNISVWNLKNDDTSISKTLLRKQFVFSANESLALVFVFSNISKSDVLNIKGLRLYQFVDSTTKKIM